MPDPEIEMDTNIKEYLHNIRMEDNDDEGFDIYKDDLKMCLTGLAQKIQRTTTTY